MTYSISEIFDTISGEAPTAGERATFVRLHGCSVKCKTCDTLYSVFTETIGFKKGYLKGLAAGDGHFTAQPTLSIGMKDREALDRALSYWKDVFGNANTSVKERVRGVEALKPGAVYYRLDICGKDNVNSIKETPNNTEERRGFVSGFYDAEGSFPKPGMAKKSWGPIEFSNGEDLVLDLVSSCLNDWGFLHFRGGGLNKRMGRTLHNIRITSFEKGGLRPGMEYLSEKCRQEYQRFFDTYRPAIKRKYGPCLYRWEALSLTAEEIAPKCNENLVIISGAEPLEQNLDNLISILRKGGHKIQVETSGVFEFQGYLRPHVLVCSPKPNVKYRVASSVMESATIFKLVNGPEGSGLDWNGALARELHKAGKKVFVMPYGQPPSQKSIEEAAQLALVSGYSFSPRLHYILGVR